MKKQHGFSMVEVLISLLILLLGVLGMMGLQAQSVNNSELAHYGSIAEMQATSLAAAMRANPAYWGAPHSEITVKPGAVPGVVVISGGPAPYLLGCGSGSGCSADEVAYTDLLNWGTLIAGNGPLGGNPDGNLYLPAGNLDIKCNSAAPVQCQVLITWQEKNISLNNDGNPANPVAGGFAAGTSTPASYQILVSII